MSIDLYVMPGSPLCCTVGLVAATLGVELNLKQVNLWTLEHRTPEFLKINPQHSVPTISDNGFILWESRAICTYLIDNYGKDDSLYPKDPKKRAVVNQRIYFDMGSFYQSFDRYLYPRNNENAPINQAKIEKIHEALGFLNQFLEGQNYVAGDHLTVADIILITTAMLCTIVDFDMGKYKNVERWMKRISAELPKYQEIFEELKGYKKWIQSVLREF